MPASDTASSFKAAATRATALDRSIRALDTQARATMRKLVDAGREAEFETADLQRKLLQGQQREVRSRKDDHAELTADVLEIEKDEAFIKNRQNELSALTKCLAGMRKMLDGLLEAIDSTLSTTQQNLRAQEFEAFKRFRDMQKLAVDALARVAALQTAVDAEAGRAQSCCKSGNREGLAAAQAALAEQARSKLPAVLKVIDQVEDQIRDYVKTWSPDNRWAGLKDIGKNIVTLRDEVVLARKGLETAQRRIDDAARLQPRPPDLEKAAKVLRLERYKDQLRRALEEKTERMERMLDQLAKLAGLGETGRELVGKLVRAGVL